MNAGTYSHLNSFNILYPFTFSVICFICTYTLYVSNNILNNSSNNKGASIRLSIPSNIRRYIIKYNLHLTSADTFIQHICPIIFVFYIMHVSYVYITYLVPTVYIPNIKCTVVYENNIVCMQI